MPNEQALRDENRVPSLLFEKGGEIKRVSDTQPLPVEQPLRTANRETVGNVDQVLIQPATGKRLVIKGVMIVSEKDTGESRIYLSAGSLAHRVYGKDQSGYVPLNIPGAVEEALKIQTTGFGTGDQAYFLVNYVEQ
ncbi:MAG: hypothetical protein HY547_02815 [Elusimicrobia bacterium]|nr:hypothetical protein [Elusimicrobiota bacterium]